MKAHTEPRIVGAVLLSVVLGLAAASYWWRQRYDHTVVPEDSGFWMPKLATETSETLRHLSFVIFPSSDGVDGSGQDSTADNIVSEDSISVEFGDGGISAWDFGLCGYMIVMECRYHNKNVRNRTTMVKNVRKRRTPEKKTREHEANMCCRAQREVLSPEFESSSAVQ